MGTVFGKNTTSSSITVAGHKVYYIDSTDAEIVEVQDGSNVKYNAFKYLLSGTPYWYVIDGEHDTWTDDLSAWGYSEVPVGPVLPTVTLDNWILPDTSSGTTTIQGGSTAAAGKAGAIPREKVAFDNSCVYATAFWRHADNSFAGRVEIAPVSNSGYIGLHNTTNQALEVYWVNYAICSDSTTTVVTVYDSNNNAYNAFKYTINNTDYYYVLDGTQTDWTDDLAGIGYSLYLTAYMNASGTPEYSYGGQYALYDHSGNLMPSDDTKTYTEIRTYTSSSDTVGQSGAINWLRSMSGKLRAYCNTGFTIQRIEYNVS